MSGTIEVRRPRVRGLEERFESRILPLFMRRTHEVTRMLPELYLTGCLRVTSNWLCGGFWATARPFPRPLAGSQWEDTAANRMEVKAGAGLAIFGEGPARRDRGLRAPLLLMADGGLPWSATGIVALLEPQDPQRAR